MISLDIPEKQRWMTASSFIHSVVNYLGCNKSEVDVDAITGFAFRNAVWDGMLPGAFNSSFHWYDAFQSAFDRLGFTIEILLAWRGQNCFESYKEHTWNKIIKSIEEKKPVLIWESFEFAVVRGFEGDTLLINGISGKKKISKTQFAGGDISTIFAAIPISKNDTEKKVSDMLTLRAAVTIGLLDKPQTASALHPDQGVAAYKKWTEELNKDFNLFGNAQYIRIMLQARRSAALYLAEVAKTFVDVPQNLLLRASERFAQVHAKLITLSGLFPFPKKDEEYPYPDIEEAQKLLEDCYIMETEGLNLIATAVENIDLRNENS